MEFFDLDEKDARYPRKAIISTRMKLKNTFKYPLWSLKYAEYELTEDEKTLIELLDLIIKNEDIQKSEGQLPRSVEDAIKDIVNIFDRQVMGIEAEFLKAKFFSIVSKPENYQRGFFAFVLQNIKSELLKRELTGKDIIKKEYLYQKIDEQIRALLQEEPWAWREEEVQFVIDLLESEMLLVRELCKVFEIKEECIFIDEILGIIQTKLSRLEYLPLWMYPYHPESTRETKAIFNAIHNMLKISDPAKIRKEFQFRILQKQVSAHEELLSKILSDRNKTLQSWVLSRFSEQLDGESLNKILEELQKLMNASGITVDEHLVFVRVQALLDKLKVVRIKKEISDMLMDILNTTDVRSFLRTKRVPIELIKYLPDIDDKEASKLEELVRNIMDFGKISSEERLSTIKKNLSAYKQKLVLLRAPDIHYRIFKNFFGDEWIEGFLTDRDLDEFIRELASKYGDNVEQWNSKQIRTFYREWIKRKYQIEMYNKIQETLRKLSPEELKEVVATIIQEEPEVGLKLARMIKNMKGEG